MNLGLDLFKYPQANSNLNENVHSILYSPKHDYVHDNLWSGFVDFDRQKPRKEPGGCPFAKTPHPYDVHKVIKGFHQT